MDKLNFTLLCYLRLLFAADGKLTENKEVFTHASDLEKEKEILAAYQKIIEHVLHKAEETTTLQQDLELIVSTEMSTNMRYVLIYRSERKKIIHSQLHLITFLQRVLVRSE